MDSIPTTSNGVLPSNTHHVAFQSYFIIVLVLTCIAVAVILYKFGVFLVGVRNTPVWQAFFRPCGTQK